MSSCGLYEPFGEWNQTQLSEKMVSKSTQFSQRVGPNYKGKSCTNHEACKYYYE